VALLRCGSSSPSSPSEPAAPSSGERFQASAIDMNAVGSNMVSLTIQVDRWSTPQERDALVAAIPQGSEAGLQALQKLPRVGFIKTSTSLGWDIHFAWQRPDGMGRRIYVATDRPVSFWEASRMARTMDYPITLIEMRVDDSGQGEGSMSVATKVTLDKERRTVELENYGTQPVRLNNVRSSTSSH
jgi:hypothetical protein